MFSSISFMFSLSLAFITWIILCYLKLIEEQRQLDDIRVELYTEHGQRSADLRVEEKVTQCSEPTSDIDKYLNFFWIFACLCALTKFMQCVESYLEKRISPALSSSPPTQTPVIATIIAGDLRSSLPILMPRQLTPPATPRRPLPLPKVNKSKLALVAPTEVENEKIVVQLQQLENRCTQMQRVLAEIKDSNTELVRVTGKRANVAVLNELQASEPLNTFILSATHSSQSPKPSLLPNNVFITNSHIHISGQIFVNQRNININLPNPMPVRARKESEFLQVWAKFIKPNEPQPLIASVARRNFLI